MGQGAIKRYAPSSPQVQITKKSNWLHFSRFLFTPNFQETFIF